MRRRCTDRRPDAKTVEMPVIPMAELMQDPTGFASFQNCQGCGALVDNASDFCHQCIESMQSAWEEDLDDLR